MGLQHFFYPTLLFIWISLKDLWKGRSTRQLWRDVSMTTGKTNKWKKHKTMGVFLLLIFGFCFVVLFWGLVWIFLSFFSPHSKLELDKRKMKTFHLLVSKLFDRRCNLVFELYLVCVITGGIHHQSMWSHTKEAYSGDRRQQVERVCWNEDICIPYAYFLSFFNKQIAWLQTAKRMSEERRQMVKHF